MIVSNDNSGVIPHLVSNNTKEYNYAKCAEELAELSLVLQQKLLKPTKVEDQEIIDEIGDVYIRLQILESYFQYDDISERIKYKLDKYQEYIENKSYSLI